MPPRKKPRNEIAHPRPCREASVESSIQSVISVGPVDWTPPPHLTGRAVEEWTRIVRHLNAHGIGREGDRAAIESAARLWDLHTRALDAVERRGLSATVGRGKTKTSSASAVRVAIDTIAQLRQIWGALGMTPDSRMRIRAATEDDKNKAVTEWLYGDEVRPLKKDEDY